MSLEDLDYEFECKKCGTVISISFLEIVFDFLTNKQQQELKEML